MRRPDAEAQFAGLEVDALRKAAELELEDARGRRHRDAPQMQLFFGPAQDFKNAGKPPGSDFRPDFAQGSRRKRRRDAVVHAGNEFGELAFALLQRHACFFEIVIAASGGVRLGCARNAVDLRGDDSEEPFNVSAIVRQANRPMLLPNAVLLAGAFERLAVELAAVAAMHAVHESVHRPVIGKLPLDAPGIFREDG